MSDMQLKKQQQLLQQMQQQNQQVTQQKQSLAQVQQTAQVQTQEQKTIEAVVKENKYLQSQNDADLDAEGMEAEFEQIKKERAMVGLGKHNVNYDNYKKEFNNGQE